MLASHFPFCYFIAGVGGFEPPTYALTVRYSAVELHAISGAGENRTRVPLLSNISVFVTFDGTLLHLVVHLQLSVPKQLPLGTHAASA
jgi:hypothetical protein